MSGMDFLTIARWVGHKDGGNPCHAGHNSQFMTKIASGRGQSKPAKLKESN